MAHMSRDDMIRTLNENHIDFLSLQFTDIPGTLKNVTVAADQLEKALNNQCMFDGSSMEGFIRIRESDMYLRPDPDSFLIYPWNTQSGQTARMICEIILPDGRPYAGDPRYVLKRVLDRAAKKGFTFCVGSECEFYLFQTDELGHPTTDPNDTAGYFDLGPSDQGEDARREICLTLEQMGFEIEASHHEAAFGQHEIDFKYNEALGAADQFVTFKMVVKSCANENGLYATFMPKPVFGKEGSGMHMNFSLFQNGKNVFFDSSSKNGLSRIAQNFIAGVLSHIRGICAVTNPLVNSYKRLVRGEREAPNLVAWSQHHRGALLRIPAARGQNTRVDLRSPDPTCNPYLSFALLLAAGLDGIERNLTPPSPIFPGAALPNDLETLPADLGEAIELMEKDSFVKNVLGDLLFAKYVEAKEEEWHRYSTSVTDWELRRYLSRL